jgi:ornithine cyclodeaminase/alanine dehydrogenase-like protein (mu-crystallin family)
MGPVGWEVEIVIHITEEQVCEALPMAKAIEVVEESFRRLSGGVGVNHPRRRVVLENSAVLHYMAAGDNRDGLLGAKIYATKPGVGARFLVVLFDAERAELLATLDANALGQIRTGAATGVATRHLARADAAVLGLIGSGFQAETQLAAVAAVRPLRSVRVFSRSAEKRSAFAARMSKRLGLAVEAVETARGAVEEADIVVTVTSARQPVVEGAWLPRGCHVNAAGSNQARRREIDAAVVERSAVVAVDFLEQAKMEAGDLIGAVEEGALAWERVTELAAIVSGGSVGRRSDDEITLFESLGLAMEDLAVANYVYREVAGR